MYFFVTPTCRQDKSGNCGTYFYKNLQQNHKILCGENTYKPHSFNRNSFYPTSEILTIIMQRLFVMEKANALYYQYTIRFYKNT